MGTLDGKVALVTGAARGQGRSHAVRLAEEGADIIALDVCAPVATVENHGATEADRGGGGEARPAHRRETGRRARSRRGAGRHGRGPRPARPTRCGGGQRGIFTSAPVHELTEEQWDTMIDVNLTGVWKTVRATVPTLIEQGTGGSIILISSTGGVQGFPNFGHYVAAKHGVLGLARTMCNELGRHNIRVNSIHPTSVLTDMIDHVGMYKLFRPDLDEPTRDQFREALSGAMNVLPVDAGALQKM